MKTPGPDHPITLTPADRRWRVKFQGHVIADSADALILQEASYPAVVYFPRSDVSMEYLSRTTRTTHCPYKGDAAYFTLMMDGHLVENGVWTYEAPYPAMSPIEGRLAFYPNEVEIYAVDDDAAPRPSHSSVDAAVQHTDTGAGYAQRDHWPPNVETPGLDDAGR